MSVVARLWDTNYWKATASVLSADSTYSPLPLRYTLDQLRSKVWRSDGPWVVVAGFNDKLDITVDVGPTTFAATLTAGTYTSATAYAAMVKTAIEAADTTGHTWPITYDTATLKFTITPAAPVAWHALTATGANVATAAWKDLGYRAADPAGTSLTSDTAVSQSRHYIALDLGSSLALTCAQALRHNLSATGTITLKTSNTSVIHALTAGNSDALSLTDLTTLRATAYAYITRTNRYAAFLIDDTANTAGYSEVGVPYVGTFRAFTVQYSNRFGELGDDLSDITRATDGAQFVDVRAEAREWTLEWADISSASGDLASFQAFRTGTPKGVNFFLDLDQSKASAAYMVYVFRTTALPIPTTSGDYYSPSFNVAEALG